jgi:hypothetical protein
MEEKRKKEINEMADNIGHPSDEQGDRESPVLSGVVSPGLVTEDFRQKFVKAEEEIEYKSIEIPKCESEPVNGRIYVIDAPGKQIKSKVANLILPQRMAPKKDDSMQEIKRYFVVAWDTVDIPESIRAKLAVGKEVNPFLPEEALNWSLPKVIDWVTGNVFLTIHYTELAGISKFDPEKIDDGNEKEA